MDSFGCANCFSGTDYFGHFYDCFFASNRGGVSRQTVNAIENNKYDPTLSLAFSLARELQLTVDELFMPS
ncbi:MAG: helix-turn-helix transcriptional regulator [Candidatus Fournierella pullistercoris]|uniref:Helix-turn-helix transcriptional regulator n=1 Tax=Candidatus Allofournierella pullistercoris TaxID=2838597 RepID=A0A948WQE8_9FIRM|nr:helix-turn-helix transcriptional regulator [Candidatus Fournierella pullistercoris]